MLERFELEKFTKALVVQATGTGKTRVATAIMDIFLKTNQAKRILFLCDRRELRKQARNVFRHHLPNAQSVIVTGQTYKERHHQIYLATYPAMMKVYESFDVGFFDLVIADESHRSIYNIYRDLFLYFDAFQLGLTATPEKLIDRNTFKLFGAANNDAAFAYGLEQAIKEGYLIAPRVISDSDAISARGYPLCGPQR